MLNGDQAAVGNGDGVTIDGAHVVIANVPASNGFIHAVDAVLLPPDLGCEPSAVSYHARSRARPDPGLVMARAVRRDRRPTYSSCGSKAGCGTRTAGRTRV